MFPHHFHYEDVSRQDLLLKPNHANVMEVPGFSEVRVVPKAGPAFSIPNGKLAMEIACGQKFKEPERSSSGKFFQSNPLAKKGDSGSSLLKQGTELQGPYKLRKHGIAHFLVRISTVMSLLDSQVEIRENSILFSMEKDFCEFSPELEDHLEIFELMLGFNLTILTSAKTEDDTFLLWSGFLQKDEG